MTGYSVGHDLIVPHQPHRRETSEPCNVTSTCISSLAASGSPRRDAPSGFGK